MKPVSYFRAAVGLWVLAIFVTTQTAFAQAPTTVIHVINIKWKVDATPEQIKAVVDAVQQLPMRYSGIKRVWTKNLKYQGGEGYKTAIVMEFESPDALKKYDSSAAQKWWYDMYLPVRDDSRTIDVTN